MIYRSILAILLGICLWTSNAAAQTVADSTVLIPLEYRKPKLSLNPYDAAKNSSGGLFLHDPANYAYETVYDPQQKRYVFRRKLGNLGIGTPFSLSTHDYLIQKQHNDFQSYIKQSVRQSRSLSASSTRSGFMPSFNVGGETFDRIFGTNIISVVPQLGVDVIFGLNSSRTENPAISESARRTTTFDFDSKFHVNVAGSVGDKLRLSINYNSEASFDFENEAKLVYEGKDDEIIRKIEAGNVTLPLPGSLITGSQSLFGLKTELQFGNLTLTAVASQQKGQTETMEIKGGAQVNEFSLRADAYEANKHFFLAQYFRDHYEDAFRTLPTISSGITITKLEVWVTNRSGSTTGNRNVVGFVDLGESKHIYNPINGNADLGEQVPDNDDRGMFNTLYKNIQNIVRSFNAGNINSELSAKGLRSSIDFEKLENARLLTSREYTFQPALGYISLNTALNADEVLCVAYEYTYRGRTYKVGELSSSGIAGDKGLVVKMLKGTNLSPRYPTWKLMMKNIYSLTAYNLQQNDFSLNILYADDKTGNNINYIPEDAVSKDRLLTIMNLDRLNANQDANPDGIFDFVNQVTIQADNGRIIFPVLEPFGGHLRSYLESKNLPEATIQKYVYQALYDSTLTKAREQAELNKFLLEGRYSSEGGSEIQLNAMNIPEGSVIVTASGTRLVENVDYTVDYNMGRVKILNTGLLESGTPIKVSVESNALFAIQQKNMLGLHANYKISEKFNLGATVLRLTERPLTQKVNIGDEPLSNTMLGFNMNYNTNLPFLTNWIDKLPLIQTKVPSTLDFTGEIAQLLPGVSKGVMNEGSAYIDDFEAGKTAYDLRAFSAWHLASIPRNDNPSRRLFPESSLNNDLNAGKNRARLAWYTIDPLFTNPQYMSAQVTPDYMRLDPERWTSSNFVRTVYEEELFPNREFQSGYPTHMSVLNVAFYPRERGPYNYDALPTSYSAGMNADGSLRNPRTRWGGMMREMQPSDFETNNIQYIEFWLMDPFIEHMKDGKGVDLYLNLGNISEDILPDARKSSEQGLPTNGDLSMVDSTAWGYVPKVQPIVHSFDANRNPQDVGLDGMNDLNEQRYFQDFLNDLESITGGNQVLTIAQNDPSNDNFIYPRGDQWDLQQADILTRYKYYNGMDGNSSNNEYTNSSLPNEEDINRDNTMSETESYFQYKIPIRPGSLQVGQNYIVDKVSGNGNTDFEIDGVKQPKADWYQFRIPITEYEQAVGDIQDFKSIRFMRMFLTNCEDSVILRFAKLELVRGEWREYKQSFQSATPGISTPQGSEAHFEIAAVNIEENANRTPVPYMVPPGFDRAIDQTSRELQQLNEQAMVLRVTDISNGDARAAYKTVTYDMRKYKSIEMEVHAEEIAGYPITDNEFSVFVRLGTDYKNNYYEYEIPLKLTQGGLGTAAYTDIMVWPEENRMYLDLTYLPDLKQARNDAMRRTGSTTTLTKVFSITQDDGKTYSICGNPNLSAIRVVMVGVRYPSNPDYAGKISGIETWVNELRLSNVDRKGGWAANGRLAVRVADLATLNLSGESIQAGFGSIESKINDRSTETRNMYEASANIELGKLFPEKLNVQIPLYLGYSETFVTPEYDPTNPDVKMKEALSALENSSMRDSLKSLTQEYTQHKSLNFTNVRVNIIHDKPQFWHLSNFTFNYSYYETYHRSLSTEKNIDRVHTGGIIYDYTTLPLNIQPFKKIGWLQKSYMKLIGDFNFNPKPTRISLRTDMNRMYAENTLRNIDRPDLRMDPTVNQNFTWGRYADVQWDLARSLKLDLSFANNARVDEPLGVIDRHMKDEYTLWRDSVWHNIRNFGRTTDYSHSLNTSYSIPINKLPLLDWLSSNVSYNGEYFWNVAPIYADTSSFNPGNTISNRSSLTFSGQANLNTLYGKIPYFRKLLRNTSPKEKPKKYKTVTYERSGIAMKAGEPRSITHALNTEEIELTLKDANGKNIPVEYEVVNANKIKMTIAEDATRLSLTVKGSVAKNTIPIEAIGQGFIKVILGVKNLSISYNRAGNMTLPGYAHNANLTSMNGMNGWPFLLGWQDEAFAEKASLNNYLVKEERLNSPVSLTLTNSLSLRGTFEPFRGIRITLSAIRSYSENNSSYYTWDKTQGLYPTETRSAMQNGNYGISVIAIGSAFEKLEASNNFYSAKFEEFKRTRQIIAERRATNLRSTLIDYKGEANTINGGFDGFSQEAQTVLIPAFFATYTNRKAESVSMDDFPSFKYMLPNWDVNFDGLSNVPLIKKVFRSVGLRHGYKATYRIGSFVSNLDYRSDVASMLAYSRDLQNNFIPQYDIQAVVLDEAFSPLISFDFALKNNLTTRLELRRTRNLSLSLGNLQMTENRTEDYVIGLGYVFNNVSFTVKSMDGNKKKITSDLKLNADFSLRDSKTLIRRLGEIIDDNNSTNLPVQASAGQKVNSLKVSAEYRINNNITVSAFFDRIVNTPFVSTSYKNSTTNVGVSIHFELNQ